MNVNNSTIQKRGDEVRGFKKLFYSQKIAPYIFVLPFILTFLVFWLIPICKAGVMSFQKILPGETEFVGLRNYEKLLTDKLFLKAVQNSLIYMIGTLLLLIPFPMLFAYMLNSKLMVARDFFKSTFFIPALTSVVVAGTIFRLMFGEVPSTLMNQLLTFLGFEPIKWLKVQWSSYAALWMLACWRWTGVNILYFLSGLNSIPEELYESAAIDGATSFQRFRYISLPMLKPTTTYVLTISIYGGLAMFTESYMLWGGRDSPQNVGLTIVWYLYRMGIQKNQMGYAAAVGIILLIIVMTINVIQLNAMGLFRKEEK